MVLTKDLTLGFLFAYLLFIYFSMIIMRSWGIFARAYAPRLIGFEL